MDHGIAAATADVALATKLAALLPILDAFHYRHRNQHAASHWWSAFQLFRRGTRSLAADLRRHQMLSRSQAENGKKSTTTKTRSKIAQRQLLARVTLFCNHTVPKAYLYLQMRRGTLTNPANSESCFSQLVADNQHATLGLLLLSALASMNSILTSISPLLQGPITLASATYDPVPDMQPPDSTPKQRQPQQGRNFNNDKGVAISRDHIPGPVPKPSKSSNPTPREDTTPKSGRKRSMDSMEKLVGKPKKKKPKKKDKDELSSLFGSL
ncbi:hypothetical protein CCM_05788 [Cordyceps militaris CM01]|uniref:RNase MRP protein 1 RNA binding domain-containing protein n=1 Tax=Cordyceps militaris (strain CM01) TaxID=983644 RepID=G3JH74_CORMM|nr:uncharacterized protein CCM_05788 [Cordyceps militaris CM01]EGX91630.1 hypothetical protein CCM_05788 [Cordyceps militaris CM01]